MQLHLMIAFLLTSSDFFMSMAQRIVEVTSPNLYPDEQDTFWVTRAQMSPPQYKRRGILYPQETSTREVRTLDGIWHFRVSPDPKFGYRRGWYKMDLYKTGPVMMMPVPSSFNDIVVDIALRDHVGVVWYDRRFYVPIGWIKNKQRIWLRFSGVNYSAQVWVNGHLVMTHEMGHLPFEKEITKWVSGNSSNLLSVAVDNTLLSDTIPQGSLSSAPGPNGTARQTQFHSFDYFNYAGIHRSVFLYTTPQDYIDNIVVNTEIQGLTGFAVFNITFDSPDPHIRCVVELFDKSHTRVADCNECDFLMMVDNAHLWWPHLAHQEPGYLYTLKVSLTNGTLLLDTYDLKIGFRTVTWNKNALYLNNKLIYLRGFGMHEDADLRGMGWDPVLWTKNFNLLKWAGANVFRTANYPYAEEVYQMADELGIMIIDECQSTRTDLFTQPLLKKHKQVLTEFIARDRNHPSVIMWAIAYEPKPQEPKCDEYFLEIVKHVKTMDLSRPLTINLNQLPHNGEVNLVAKHLDVISFNRYVGFRDTGNLRDLASNVYSESKTWHHVFKKPVLISEYGTETIAGQHSLPGNLWSEEYQIAKLSEYFKAFDNLRKTGYFVGEFIWSFADFATIQATSRLASNRKGVFDRSRQPKAAAHHLRARYLALAAADASAPPPKIGYYISDNQPAHHEL